MVYLIVFIGLCMLFTGADDLNGGFEPSSLVAVVVGGVLLLAALIGWFLARGYNDD